MLPLFLVIFILPFEQILAADECYFCLEKCDSPLLKQQCHDDYAGNNVTMKCYSLEMSSETGNFVEKGCLPADFVDVECKIANENPNIDCTVCDGDLCNNSGKYFCVNNVTWVLTVLALFLY